jgi:predicted RNA-binding protein
MCDYSLVLIKQSKEEQKVLESVDEIIREGDVYVARNIFGEKIEFSGELERFDSSNNKIIFKEG